jgi:hypothetical protein
MLDMDRIPATHHLRVDRSRHRLDVSKMNFLGQIRLSLDPGIVAATQGLSMRR